MAGARPGQSRGIQELRLGSLCKWQGPKYLSGHLLPPRTRVSRKLESRMELGLEPRHSMWVQVSQANAQPKRPVFLFN